jgi:hypothetical protein
MIEPTLTKEEALRESAYLAGLKAGWNLGIIRNVQGMRQAQESRDGYLEFIKPQTNGAHLRAANKGAEYASNVAHTAYRRSFKAEDRIAELEQKIEALNDTGD